MSSAVVEARRVLKPDGRLVDIHPTDEASSLQVWHATARDGAADVTAANLAAIHRQPIGPLDHDPDVLRDFTCATDALAAALESGFELLGTQAFDYCYFFDTLDELTDYLEHEDDQHATANDELVERAVLAMRRAAAPPKLVVVQRTVATALLKV